MSVKKIARKHIANHFDKETVDAKLKVYYKGPKNRYSFSVKLKMEKDEVIWLKGTKFITVFKAKITPTSVQYYSPLEKKYFEGDFAILEKLLGTEINFKQLQNLLLGQSVFNLKEQKYSAEIISDSYILTPEKQLELFDVFFKMNPTTFKLQEQRISNSDQNQELKIKYNRYIEKSKTLFPGEIVIDAEKNGKRTNIKMDVKSLEFDKKLDFSYRVPKGYKRTRI
jgi:hypothetical protein